MTNCSDLGCGLEVLLSTREGLAHLLMPSTSGCFLGNGARHHAIVRYQLANRLWRSIKLFSYTGTKTLNRLQKEHSIAVPTDPTDRTMGTADATTTENVARPSLLASSFASCASVC